MNNTKENKMCLFFASDYHFEMITLPYIEKELEKDKEIVVLTDKDLVPTVKNLVSKITLPEEKKEKILSINWKNEDKLKIENLKNAKKEIIVFIKGKKKYVTDMRRNISEYIESKNIKCIDCYDVNEVSENLAEIASKYDSMLKTMGEVNKNEV